MNHWAVHAQKCGTQFIPVVRRIDRAEPYLLKRAGRAVLMPTVEAAELEAHRHIMHLLNTEPRFMPAPPMSRDTVALQLEVFGTVTSRKGKSSEVRHRRRRTRRGAHDKKEAAE